ncbi:MAG: hypothetical protein QOD04_5724, partial [Pseudonocardiales bacterium]|nr:hypothetical protein [Pseudonocardiales bacterium]
GRPATRPPRVRRVEVQVPRRAGEHRGGMGGAAYPNIAPYAHLFPALDDPADFSTLIELLVDSIDARARRATGRQD